VSIWPLIFLIVVPENREEEHQQQYKTERPFDAGQESRIAPLVLGNIHRAGRVMGITMFCHAEKSPVDQTGPDYSKAGPADKRD
jgi:hypothetical protein